MSSYPNSGACKETGTAKSQAYTPSGISTRGSMELMDSEVNPPGTSGSQIVDNDEEGAISGLVARPLSSSTRYEVYSQLSQGGFPLGSIFGKLQGNSQGTSHSLGLKINRLIKMEKRVMKLQQHLIRDIGSWCNVLPNEDSKQLLYHLIKVLEVEYDVTDRSIKKQSQIVGLLANVNKRERRTNELKLKRNKMLSKLRESENKMGDNPVTILTKENLEELECSVEIVEDQFIRSINNGLKNSLVDYVTTLRQSGAKYREASCYFLDNYNFNSRNEGSASNLQRLILQNKYQNPPTSASRLVQITSGIIQQQDVTRDITTSLSYQKNYIALSPNHVGKYLDNVYDDEDGDPLGPVRERAISPNRTSKPLGDQSEPLSAPEQQPTLIPTSATVPNGLDQAYSIISSYSMSVPGGLSGMRPPTTNHEWTT